MKNLIIDLEIIDDLEQSGVSAISLVEVPAIEKNWMAFKREEFVTPSKGERQDAFIPRCIAKLVGDEGYETSQAAAICYSTWGETHSENFSKISFDWNDTLSTDRGFELAKSYAGNELYIISAINEVNQAMRDRAAELGIPESRIFATGSNKAKIEKIKELGIDKHIDNNDAVISELGPIGINFTFADYPWDKCIEDQLARGLNEESANRLCGWIRSNYQMQFADSYTDYPEAAKQNAQRALDWVAENGWGSCGTPVGKMRANQLAKGEPISEETIARMASFERHRQNSETPYGEGCGKLMWDAWGGSEGIEWASKKLEEIRTELSYDVSALPPFIDELPKKKEMFFASEDQQIIVGPVAIPDIIIPRVDPKTKERYNVRFSAETISKMAEKFMREMRNDSTNIEHDGAINGNSYVKETWIVETSEDKANTKYGLDVPVGTWMVSMRVTDPKVWRQIKSGQLNGFSLEGNFMDKKEYEEYKKDRETYTRITNILKNL